MFNKVNEDIENEAKEIVEDTESIQIEAYTLEDSTEKKEICSDCIHYEQCPIIVYVNNLEKIRSIKKGNQVKTVEQDFSCNIFSK